MIRWADPFLGYGIAMGLVSIMVAMSGIILGIGLAMDDRKLKELGRSELYQAIINGIIVGSLFLAFSQGGRNDVAYQFRRDRFFGRVLHRNTIKQLCHMLCTPVPCRRKSRNDKRPKLSRRLMDSALGVLAPTVGIYAALSFVASLKVSLVIVSFGFTAMLQPVLNVLNYIMTSLSMTMASLEIQGILLEFVAGTALSVLLP